MKYPVTVYVLYGAVRPGGMLRIAGAKEEKVMREKLTKSDVEKIQAEIEHRKLVERKELIEAVKEARSHGDLSENF